MFDMKKKIISLTLVIFLLSLLTSCKSSSTKIVVASDIHYLSRELMDGGEAFTDFVMNDDGKAVMYMEEILNKFVDEMIKLKPDLVVLTGDLTFEGERVSHEELSEILSKLTDKGIKVAVMPGNHDCNNVEAKGYSGSETYEVESINYDEFREIYSDMGYTGALSYDDNSLSYIVEINEKTWAVLIDVNCNSNPWYVDPGTLDWLREKLEYANDNGISVFSFTHQNLQNHGLNTTGYKIRDVDDELFYALIDNNVKANFTGHNHFQHYVDLDNLKEISTAAMGVYPCYYGLIEIKGNSIEYNAKAIKSDHYSEIKSLYYDTLMNKYGLKFEDGNVREYYVNLLANFYNGTMSNISVKEEYIPLIEAVSVNAANEVRYITEQAGNDYTHVVIE